MDYSKYEPFRLDKCTVINDISKFLDTHRTLVKHYESIGSEKAAKPYRDRGVSVVMKLKELENKTKK